MSYKPETQMRHLVQCKKCAEKDIAVQVAAQTWLEDIVEQRKKREALRSAKQRTEYHKYVLYKCMFVFVLFRVCAVFVCVCVCVCFMLCVVFRYDADCMSDDKRKDTNSNDYDSNIPMPSVEEMEQEMDSNFDAMLRSEDPSDNNSDSDNGDGCSHLAPSRMPTLVISSPSQSESHLECKSPSAPSPFTVSSSTSFSSSMSSSSSLSTRQRHASWALHIRAREKNEEARKAHIKRIEKDSMSLRKRKHAEPLDTVTNLKHKKRHNNVKKQSHIMNWTFKPLLQSQQREGRDALARMIICGGRAYSVVEDTYFRDFVGAICPSFEHMSRKTLTQKHLPSLYMETCSARNDRLKKSRIVTMVVDSSDDQCHEHITHVMAVTNTGHAFLIYQLQHEGEPKTAEVMVRAARHGLNMLNELKVSCALVVVDNEKKMKKFRRLVSIDLKLHSIGCAAHAMNLVIGEGLRRNDEIEEAVAAVQTILDKIKNSTLRDYIKRNMSTAHGFDWETVKGRRMGVVTPGVTLWNSFLDAFEYILKIKRMWFKRV